MAATEIPYLNSDESKRFFTVVEDDRDRAIFLLMYRMGLRVGEVVGEELDYWCKNGIRCKNSDVPEVLKNAEKNKEVKDKKDRWKHVTNTIPGLHRESIDWPKKVIFVRGKGKKTRTVPIHPEVYEILLKYINPFADGPRNGPVFDIGPPMVRWLCKNYGEKAGIGGNKHPHQFRHTFAINYLKAGGNIRALQKILGHSSLAVTERYLQYVEKDILEDMEKVAMKQDMEKNPDEFKRELAKKLAEAITEGR